jgi:hypothetical protein
MVLIRQCCVTGELLQALERTGRRKKRLGGWLAVILEVRLLCSEEWRIGLR